MEFDFDELRTAFDEQSTVFGALVSRVDDLAAPTELDGWDVAVLVGHASTAVEALWRWRGVPSDGAVEIDSVSWWDAVDAGVNDDFAQRYAAKRTHRQLRDTLAAAIARASGLLPDVEPDACLVAPGGAAWSRFDQALATRIFELTVHGVDLARAVDDPAAMAPAAVAVAGRILDARLPGDRPDELTGVDWLLAATGRSPHPDPRLPVVH